jgi:predicted amidophosphoribosyltransferase
MINFNVHISLNIPEILIFISFHRKKYISFFQLLTQESVLWSLKRIFITYTLIFLHILSNLKYQGRRNFQNMFKKFLSKLKFDLQNKCFKDVIVWMLKDLGAFW